MVTIPLQFNGPDHSGNGGFVGGTMAAEIGGDGPVASTLRLPPPLDTPLSWERDGTSIRLLTAGGAVVGEAAPGTFARDVPTSPTLAEAEAAQAAYPGHLSHPFDHCFTCGTQRAEGEGLRIFSGPIRPGRSAATWTPNSAFVEPDGFVSVPVTWAALDCVGGWSADFTKNPFLLGRMTAEALRRPAADEPCLVVGELAAREGRRFLTSTALYTVEGELLGRSEQIWIVPNPR